MSAESKAKCPFVYANGKRCTGHVESWKLYGHRRGEPLFFTKKVRLWCDEMGDHAGAVSSWASKERMEFYPNQLDGELYKAIEVEMASRRSHVGEFV